MNEPSLKNLTSKNFWKPPKRFNTFTEQLGAPHVSSFNYMATTGLDEAVADLHPHEFQLPNGDKVKISIEEANISKPLLPLGIIGSKKQVIMPSECRQRAATYKGRLSIRIHWSVNGLDQMPFEKDLGEVPIMVKSKLCNLHLLDPKQLVANGEHDNEWGGYFIIKGHERLIRMLLTTRRNYPVAIRRSAWKSRGTLFSDSGISIRCVAKDQTATTNVLHFVTDGTVKLMFSHKKSMYYAPLVLILKCLTSYVDVCIYKKLIEGYEDDLYYSDCVQTMLRTVHLENLHTQFDCKSYLGKMFRLKFIECPAWWSDIQVADFIIKKCIMIHLEDNQDKFNALVFMTKKLFVFVQGCCKVEGADSIMMQELILGGHVYLQVIKEKLQSWLLGLQANILKMSKSVSFSLTQQSIITAAKFTSGLEKGMEFFLATGNLVSKSGLGLMQDKGLTIVAENINRMRYMSHFKSVHRGAFFQEMRTTEARQLLPDAWGFICPVHTPDGAPCGLLNHLTMDCIVTDVPDYAKVENIPRILVELGMVPIGESYTTGIDLKNSYNVILDGKVLGYISKNIITEVVNQLRFLKTSGEEVPMTLEIAQVPLKKWAQFPGLYLYTGPARMMRPLLNLITNKIELVGTLEQVYLDVCVCTEEIYKGITTHMELSKTGFLSNLAQLIPMPDCNQSPRNMYQCQMGKQTMGTPCHNWDLQAETKMYRLQTPQSPLFRPVHYDEIGMDDYAMGTNAVVAVISYTGYDMEDAMIINKMSEERGLAHGSIYKSEFIQLEELSSYFCRDPLQPNLTEHLDTDGFPYIGKKMKYEDPYYCYYNKDESKFIVKRFKSKEDCFVHSVKLCGSLIGKAKRLACVTFRVSRNPSVGDKFASRAGQKGICAQKWAMEDLPWTETGLVPDIVFNPHGFPSRMTIAMMIEVMAGKSGALHGLVHDASPFKFNEEDTAIDYFGRLLEAGGYNYYGTETMYSGIDGREMEVQIFFGVVHYQKLRHMVLDKWQVRSTGPVDILTRQPIKGRKRGGGVRFGEMERDALISHGTAFLLQDRLFECSDKVKIFICTKCSSILSPVTVITRKADKPSLTETHEFCRMCGNGKNISELEIPYIFKFLCAQLASCNINIKIKTKPV